MMVDHEVLDDDGGGGDDDAYVDSSVAVSLGLQQPLAHHQNDIHVMLEPFHCIINLIA